MVEKSSPASLSEQQSASKAVTKVHLPSAQTTVATPHIDPHQDDQGHHGHRSFWLWIMCLTGVDYFSTLGYQPSIAFNSAGVLAPLATVVLVLVTLFGALPVYAHVADRSSNGQGSIAMLERLVRGWNGKIMVVALLGFAATDFVITKTLQRGRRGCAHDSESPLETIRPGKLAGRWRRSPAHGLDDHAVDHAGPGLHARLQGSHRPGRGDRRRSIWRSTCW